MKGGFLCVTFLTLNWREWKVYLSILDMIVCDGSICMRQYDISNGHQKQNVLLREGGSSALICMLANLIVEGTESVLNCSLALLKGIWSWHSLPSFCGYLCGTYPCPSVVFAAGIFAYLNYHVPRTRREILEILIKGLQRLEYRGYDSAGGSVGHPYGGVGGSYLALFVLKP